MALSCQVQMSTGSYAAGATPPPQATVFVYNPNAVPVAVTGLQMRMHAQGDRLGGHSSVQPNVPPVGPGQTVVVPALGSINIGPFPVAVASAANVNPFQMVNQTGNLNPVNPQPSQPPQYVMTIGATVQGSDGSTNEAGIGSLLVSYQSNPPLGYQGGFLNFSAPNNFLGIAVPGWP